MPHPWLDGALSNLTQLEMSLLIAEGCKLDVPSNPNHSVFLKSFESATRLGLGHVTSFYPVEMACMALQCPDISPGISGTLPPQSRHFQSSGEQLGLSGRKTLDEQGDYENSPTWPWGLWGEEFPDQRYSGMGAVMGPKLLERFGRKNKLPSSPV